MNLGTGTDWHRPIESRSLADSVNLTSTEATEFRIQLNRNALEIITSAGRHLEADDRDAIKLMINDSTTPIQQNPTPEANENGLENVSIAERKQVAITNFIEFHLSHEVIKSYTINAH